MSKTDVSIVKTRTHPDFKAINRAVQEALEGIGGLGDLVRPGDLVLVKPNWVALPGEREAGCVTLPEVCRALADAVRDSGGRPVIADSAAVGVDTETVIRGAGYDELRKQGYDVRNLEQTPWRDLAMAKPRVFETLPCWELACEADVIISVPKLKTHDQTEMTAALKNLKGLLTDRGKRDMHLQGLFEGVIDLVETLRPGLAVVDAVVCQEGSGPIYGRPVEMDLVLAGRDLVAVDAVCARLMGFDPGETYLTVNAAARGLGTMAPNRIRIRGVPLEAVSRRFLRAVEDDPVEVKGFQWVNDTSTCTGCRNSVMAALREMRQQGGIKALEGLAIVTGGARLPAGVPRGRVVTVGRCTPEADREGGPHVVGCPPNNAPIAKAIAGAAPAERD